MTQHHQPTRRIACVRSQAGQVLVIFALALPVLLGLTALVIDLGSLYAEKTSVQMTADAAALAVAQDLPISSTAAQVAVQQWTDRNRNGATSVATSPDGFQSTISVTVTKNVELILPFFGSHRTVSASATARNGAIGTGYWVAPLAVSGGSGCGRTNGDAPCIGTAADMKAGSNPAILGGYDFLAYHHLGSCTGSSFSFCFTDLSRRSGAATVESAANDAMLGEWILHGYPSPLTVPTTSADYKTDDYTAGETGTTHCGHNADPAHCLLIQKLQARAGTIILVPVFDPATTKQTLSLISFAVFRLAPPSATPTGNYVLNPKDTAHWYILGDYLTTVMCQPPPTSGGDPPADLGGTCYGTPGSGTPDFGTSRVSLIR